MFQIEQKFCKGTKKCASVAHYGIELPCLPCMALRGLVWPYVALCGLMWPYVALYGLEWPCMALYAMYGLVWP